MIQVAKRSNPYQRPDDRLYRVTIRGNVVYLYWSEMTHAQKRAQIRLEQDQPRQRMIHVEEFGIYA